MKRVEVVRQKPRAVSRRLPAAYSKLIRQYAMQTGLAVWAWNSLHANLFTMFWFLLGRGRPEGMKPTVESVWHQIQNDSTQRTMLLSVARSELGARKQMLRRVEWLINVAGRLSAYRNIVAHTPAIFSPYMVAIPIADPTAAREQARLRFNEIKHDEFWRKLTGDLNALAQYAHRLAFDIYRPGFDGPLPHRPKLRSLEQIQRIEGQIGRLAQSAAPPHPQSSYRQRRRSSRASP